MLLTKIEDSLQYRRFLDVWSMMWTFPQVISIPSRSAICWSQISSRTRTCFQRSWLYQSRLMLLRTFPYFSCFISLCRPFHSLKTTYQCFRKKLGETGHGLIESNCEAVMVHAQSRSFWRTIKGWLWQSLRWWPPHHCSVPPLPPATFVRLISELRRNTSPTPIPPTQPAFLSLSLPTSTMCFLSTTRAPPCSTHVPCSRPITSHMHQFSRSWVAVTTRTCEDLGRHPLAPSRIRVSSLYVHSTTICSSQ